MVFNPGERVEGYTNFLWIFLLSVFAKFGLNIIVVSKILGICSGCVALFLLYKISALFFQTRNRSANLAKGKNQMVHTKGEISLPQGWFVPLFPSFGIQYSQGEKYLKKAIEMDDYCMDAHFFLCKICQNRNMNLEAQQEEEKIRKYSPSLFGPKRP